jgi:hypothetical protein
MKRLIAAALLVVGMTTFAQVEKKPETRRSGMAKLSPTQRNELVLKKMTLDLDLNASQQKEMGKIIAEKDAKREAEKAKHEEMIKANKKPTADEIFAMKNKMLDEEIAMKARVKKILSPEQFEKWEKMNKRRGEKMGHRKGREMSKDEKPKE